MRYLFLALVPIAAAALVLLPFIQEFARVSL